MGTATDVARFLVQCAIDMKAPLTNMKLQKMLYFAWIEYYKVSRSYLFDDSINAWKLGPVVPEVYDEFKIFAAMPITFTKKPELELKPEVKGFLNKFSQRYRDVNAFDLVRKTHERGKPWSEAYREGRKDTVIPFESIIRLECQ